MNQATGNTQSLLRGVKEIIAVSSCKGGVGKSTIAAHLACALADRGFKVGLLDADVHGPSIPTLLNIKKGNVDSNEFKQLVPYEKGNLKVMSFGFLLGDSPAILRGPIVSQYIQQILLNTAWGELDYLLIDMPPGTGDIQLTITQSIRLSGAIIITTPQTLSLIDVARGILMFEKVNVPILGIVENMSYFLCVKCDEKHYIFGTNLAKDLTKRFGVKTIAEIPIKPPFTQSVDQANVDVDVAKSVDGLLAALEDKQKTRIPKIYTDQKQTTFTWEGEDAIVINNKDLRLSCRCALCANELTGEVVIKEKDLPQDIQPKKITPLGNYAIGIDWSDGHTSGIYPYINIKALSICSK